MVISTATKKEPNAMVKFRKCYFQQMVKITRYEEGKTIREITKEIIGHLEIFPQNNKRI